MPNLNIRVKEGQRENIAEVAARYGLNTSEFVLEAVRVLASFDESILKRVAEESKRINIANEEDTLKSPRGLYIQNLVVKNFAERDAQLEVWGRSNLLGEFIFVDTGEGAKLLTGDALYKQLKDVYIRETADKREGILLERKLKGVKLNPDDQTWMDKLRAKATERIEAADNK